MVSVLGNQPVAHRIESCLDRLAAIIRGAVGKMHHTQKSAFGKRTVENVRRAVGAGITGERLAQPHFTKRSALVARDADSLGIERSENRGGHIGWCCTN